MITKPSLRATLLAMKAGDVEHISVEMFTGNTIRNCASNVSLDLGRKYSVHVNRETKSYTVTRVS